MSKKLPEYTASEAIKKYNICGDWELTLKKIFPRSMKFTIADILNLSKASRLVDIIIFINDIGSDGNLVELSKEDSEDVNEHWTWAHDFQAPLLGIAWMLLENGYDI